MKFISSEFFRFLLSGGGNTLVTYLIYLFFLNYMPYGLAYSLTYIIGIYLSYYLSCRLVFNEHPRWRSAVQYPLVYAVQYFFGIILLNVFVRNDLLDEVIAPLVVIIITLPVTFLLSRWVIRKKVIVSSKDL